MQIEILCFDTILQISIFYASPFFGKERTLLCCETHLFCAARAAMRSDMGERSFARETAFYVKLHHVCPRVDIISVYA